jgi:hypothetical protein
MTTAASSPSSTLPTEAEQLIICQNDPLLREQAQVLFKHGDIESVDEYIRDVAASDYQMKLFARGLIANPA